MKNITQFQSIREFNTKRLHAAAMTHNDFEKLSAMQSDPEAMEKLGGARSREEIATYMDWNVAHWHMHGFGLWMFYLQDSDEWIGIGGLRRVKINGKRETEIFYELMPQYWEQGYATEISQACIEIAFDVLRLNDIIGYTQEDNTNSRRVMEKVGFEYETQFFNRGHNNVIYRLQSYKKADVVPYNEEWPVIANREVTRIKNALGDMLVSAHHIGSTSIPNMPAKPIIDIMLECENIYDIDSIKRKLHPLDYRYVRRHIIPHHTYFTNKHENDIGFNIHITERGNPQAKRHILFRDFLRQDPELAGSYAELKVKLSSEYRDDINTYVTSKDKLVQAIDTKAKLWANGSHSFNEPNTSRKASTEEKDLLQAMQANLNMHMTHFAQYLNQVELVRVPGYTLVNSGLNDDTFNYVLDADFTEAGADNAIQEISDYFLKRDLPFSWWVCPDDKPQTLKEHLLKCGYKQTTKNIAMYCDLDKWTLKTPYPEELEIKRVLDEQGLQDFAMVLTNDKESFETYYRWIAQIISENDPVEYYVGYVDGKPVTRGLISFFAGVAGLHWLSTDPHCRKKGYGTAMQQYRLQRAKECGYHLAVLQASPQGHTLYKKLGYQECGVIEEFTHKKLMHDV